MTPRAPPALNILFLILLLLGQFLGTGLGFQRPLVDLCRRTRSIPLNPVVSCAGRASVRQPTGSVLGAAGSPHQDDPEDAGRNGDADAVAARARTSTAVAPLIALGTMTLLFLPVAAVASAEEYPWATPAKIVLDPLLNLGQFAMLLRVIMSWYPQVNLNELPYNLIAWPTEPLLRVTRQVVPPAFGVDISPIVWIAILSFFREILFGQQGLVNLLLAS